MKIFEYKFSKLIKGLIFAGFAVCAAAFGFTLYQIIKYGVGDAAEPSYTIIQYALSIIFSVGLTVLLISILKRSYYAVDGNKFITCFGIIKSTYDIDKIERIELDRKTDKLSVYFKDEQYIIIVVKPEWNERFVDALLEANGNIEFDIKTDMNEDKK
ncbi:MAG: hypothetical protein J6B04_01235 [Clostridia bacterium]|nr:hypothetical protein [Clostridia bacterium]